MIFNVPKKKVRLKNQEERVHESSDFMPSERGSLLKSYLHC